MEDNISWHNLSDDDVLSFDRGDSTFRVGRFKQLVKQTLDAKEVGYYLLQEFQKIGIKVEMPIYFTGEDTEREKWFIEGADCEIMKTKEPGWKKAKARLKIAIEVWSEEPETSEPESPLDDLRQKLSDES